MRQKVYITGHRNPDTDSICSALAYAELKNRIGDVEAIPIRIGELNQETRFVLDHFGVEAPLYMQSIKLQLKDMQIDRTYGVSPEISLNKAATIIEDNHLNSLSVVDEEERLAGVISLSNITKSYANVWDDRIIGRSNTSLANILEVLNAKLIHLPENPRAYVGVINIYAMDSKVNTIIGEDDIVLVGNRTSAQKDAIERNISMLVLTNNSELPEELIKLAEEHSVTVISTGLTTFMAARLLPQSVPIDFLMTKENIISFRLDDTIDDASALMAKTRFRSYPVLDAQDRVVGSISRYHLFHNEKKKLILVDHNERSQSILDIEDAEILEIIDHHRVANVATTQPIYFRNMPVGCTCTIISQMFFEQGIRPTQKIAGLMLSAIVSDTLLFRSPTATDMDRAAVRRLAPIAGVDPEAYAMEMFKAGTDLSNKKPTDIITQDVKFFNVEDMKVKIAQVFTMDLESLGELESRLIKRMGELLNEQSEDTYVLVMTDIFKETSKLLVVGAYGDAIGHEFGDGLVENSVMAPGVLSRKKQVLPTITAAIAKAKREE